jgi:hypothetical protein
MKETQFLYRCRHCGRIFTDCFTGPDNERAQMKLIDAIHNLVVDNQSPVPMIVAHSCRNNMGGIADLIGYEIK